MRNFTIALMNDLTGRINAFKNKRMLVVGDIMLDRWTFGRVTRISPEAPVPIIEKTAEKTTLGGAGNVANNLAALGARVYLAGVVGDDTNKKSIMDLLKEKKIGRDAVLVHATRRTTEKHRIVSENSHQLFRLDIESTERLEAGEERRLFKLITPLIKKSDAVILSDYGKGVFSREFARDLIAACKKAGKTVLADFKPKNKKYFLEADVISPNLNEGREMTGLERAQDVGTRLTKDFRAHVVLTRGGDGLSVFRRGAKAYNVPGKKIKVFDVSGAGDTTIAVLALGLVSGLGIETAALLANEAGAIVVQKPGTATLSIEELASAFKISTHVENVDIVPKVWGYEKWLENNDKYCCKILSVKKGYQCSLHYHKSKDETFVVTEGHVRLELGKEVLHLRPGAFVRIPPNTHHRFTGIENSLIMEVSTHHDEADSYRLEESKKVSPTRPRTSEPRSRKNTRRSRRRA